MSIKGQIISWGAAIIAAAMVFSIGTNLIVPMVNNIRFANSPFSVVEDASYRIEGDKLFISGTVHKVSKCDPTGAPPGYFVFEYNGLVKGTGVFTSNGEPLQSRRIVDVGVKVRFSDLHTTIPLEMRGKQGVKVSLKVNCQRGDGVFRSYLVAGPVDISG